MTERLKTNKELANALTDGVMADIWYDAKQYGDTAKQSTIDQLHDDMAEAAHRLNIADELLAALGLINTDKDGDGFICREAMDQVRAAIANANGETA